MTTVIFAGGGTGGHLMPALALADEMVRVDSSIEPLFIGGKRGVEADVLPLRPWRYVLLPLEPLRRRQWWRNVTLPLTFYFSIRAINRILRFELPGLVIGTGGYVSAPVVRAAVARGIPSLIQEQNAYPGLATRWLAGKASQIHLGFPEAREHLRPGPNTQVFVTGNPIEPPPDIRPPKAEAKSRLGFAPDRPLVLVIGGSQGALAINQALRDSLLNGHWPKAANLIWQTGAGTYPAFATYAVPGRILIEAFIDPIDRAYAAADLVVARAGAMTLAEVTAWGLPAVLIPLPTAAAGHQLANARALADAAAAVLLEQPSAKGEGLGSVVAELLRDPARMADIGAAAQQRSRPNAVREIVAKGLELLSKS
ncbi:MAG: undecaprenyldiphospho-muramoylpentapeptide beta-N-acetylglucosaminyltransferase [Gemmatimonadetes bacterium]|nr:undecaprenyldiphospho-muramoylpentapeptide beta-N-acetylglucosaminyltransferase [Gemmatimonadota bacterium]